MKTRVYDVALIQYITLFETLTRTKVKDCLVMNDSLIFIVEPGNIAKAIGKQGQTVNKLQQLIKKRIKIVEFSEDVVKFIKNLINPVPTASITVDNEIVTIIVNDARTKGTLIGREASTIKQYTAIVQRFFPIKVILVK